MTAARRMRGWLTCAITLAVTATALSSCESLITKPSLYGTVSARVTRRDSTPIAGVELTLYTGDRAMVYAWTDANGWYTFKNVPENLYGVRATAPRGYATAGFLVDSVNDESQDDLILKGGESLAVHFSLLKIGAGQFIVRVVESNGSPLPNFPLLLSNDSGVVQRATTDAAGAHTFPSVPFGRYTVSASRAKPCSDGSIGTRTQDDLVSEEGSSENVLLTLAPCTDSLALLLMANHAP